MRSFDWAATTVTVPITRVFRVRSGRERQTSPKTPTRARSMNGRSARKLKNTAAIFNEWRGSGYQKAREVIITLYFISHITHSAEAP